MDVTITIPTYWGRRRDRAPEPGDAIFDHPTPLDGPSTLPRLLTSLADQERAPPFHVLVLTAPVNPELDQAAETRVHQILARFAAQFPVGQFGPFDLPHLQDVVTRAGSPGDLITLANYPGVRNVQLLVSQALGSHIVIALDDDEVVPPNYLRTAIEAVTQTQTGGVAGLYQDARGSIFLPETALSGNIFHDKPKIMNQAVRQLLARPGRFTPTFMALGGNMAFPRELFTRVGFDPGITRGEDLDYVLNAWLAGFTFWLDKELRVTHLPPHHYGTHPYAKLAEDVRRFLYQREKLRQAAERGLSAPSLEELMPYPGRFLQDDLEEHALAALTAAATPEAVARWGNSEEVVAGAITRARRLAPAYFDFAQRWPTLIQAVAADAHLRQHVSKLFMNLTDE